MNRIRSDVDQTQRIGRKFFKIELEQRRAVILTFLRLSLVYSIKYIKVFNDISKRETFNDNER